MLTPEQIEAWTVAAEALIKVGGYAVTTVKSWFTHANTPNLTPEQLAAGWNDIESDDRIRLAIAHAEAGDGN